MSGRDTRGQAHADDRRTPALSPEAACVIDTYLARVHGAMLLTAAGEAEEALLELREHVLEELAGSDRGTAAVTRVLAELGPPETLARAYGDGGDAPQDRASRMAAGRTGAADDESVEDLDGARSHLAGRVLGIPYDVRVPTARRIAHRWWNLLDRRVLVPRVWGVGWDFNLGAVAVRLGVVRPDDEDVPFGAVPDGALLAALAVPVALAAGLIAIVAVTYSGLPATVPMGWGLTGQADRYWDTAVAAAFVLAMSIVPTAALAVLHVRRASTLARAVGAAAVTLLSTLSLATWTMAVFGGAHGLGSWPIGVGIPASLALPLVLLATLSHIGSGVEMRRDLSHDQKKERS
jgi:hypothetical protein